MKEIYIHIIYVYVYCTKFSFHKTKNKVTLFWYLKPFLCLKSEFWSFSAKLRNYLAQWFSKCWLRSRKGPSRQSSWFLAHWLARAAPTSSTSSYFVSNPSPCQILFEKIKVPLIKKKKIPIQPLFYMFTYLRPSCKFIESLNSIELES